MTVTFALIAFLLPLAWSPGPGNMVFAAIGAQHGLAASRPASLGYHLATWIVTLAIGFGFSAAAQVAPALFRALALLGSAYVLWLAWRFWHADSRVSEVAARLAGTRDGAMLLLLNPKAYVIIAAMFTQFLPSDPDTARVLWITTIFTLHNLLAFTCWTLAGDLMLRQFRDADSATWINRACALMLAGVALWMLLR